MILTPLQEAGTGRDSDLASGNCPTWHVFLGAILHTPGFTDNDKAAALLGGLMVQAEYNRPPITLVAYSDVEHAPEGVARPVKIFAESCRPMIKRS